MKVKGKKLEVYSSEFKAEAVAKCLKIGASKASIELGVSKSTLHGWMTKAREVPQSSGEKPSYEELELEVQRLRREVGYVNEINRILKKSTAIFSAAEMGGSR